MPDTNMEPNTKKSSNEATGLQSHAKDASLQAKSAVHAQESTNKAKDSLGVSAAASSAPTRVESAVAQVKEQGQQLLHDAGQKAGRVYDEASDIAHYAADEVRMQARAAGRYAKRAGENSVSFVGTHALPLTVIGLGLGWLALSMRSQPRQRVSYARPRHTPSLRSEYREPLATGYSDIDRDQRKTGYGESLTSDGTTATTKLLGVRTIDSDR